MTDIVIENKIEKLYHEINQLESGLSYDTEKTLKCDYCKERKLYVWDNNSKDCEVLHFSGIFLGKYNHHIHLCKDCIKTLNVKTINVVNIKK